MSRFYGDNPDEDNIGDLIRSLSSNDDEEENQAQNQDQNEGFGPGYDDYMQSENTETDHQSSEDTDVDVDGDDRRDDEDDNQDDDIYGSDSLENTKDSIKEKAGKAKDKVKDEFQDKIDEQKDKLKDKALNKFKEKKEQKLEKDAYNKAAQKGNQKTAEQIGKHFAERNAEYAAQNAAGHTVGATAAEESAATLGGAGAKEAGKQAAKETGKEAAKETGKEAAKETGKQAAKETGKEAAKEAGKQAAKETGKQAGRQAAAQGTAAGTTAAGTTAAAGGAAGTTAAAGGTAAVAATPVGWVILIIIAVILIIIFIICAITFFVSMPGMLFGKITAVINDFVDKIYNKIDGEVAERAIDQEDVLNMAQYLQDMGYDIQGYGLGDAYYEEKEVEYEETLDDGTKTTVKETKQVTSTTPRGEISKDVDDKYVEGNNVQTTKEIKYMIVDDEDTIGSVVGKVAVKYGAETYLEDYMIASCATYLQTSLNIKGKFMSLKSFFTPGGSKEHSTGMINIPSWQSRRVSIEGTNMVITDHASLLGTWTWGDEFKFDMSDWSAIYGKPMELFLSLHFSTMMPELTDKIARDKDFNTKVNIEYDSHNVVFNNIKLKIGEEDYDSIDVAREALRWCTRDTSASKDDQEENDYEEARKKREDANEAEEGEEVDYTDEDKKKIEDYEKNNERDKGDVQTSNYSNHDCPCTALFRDIADMSERGEISDEDTVHLTAKILQVVYTDNWSEHTGAGSGDNGWSDWDTGSHVKDAILKYCPSSIEDNANFKEIEDDGFTGSTGFNNYHIAEEKFPDEAIPSGPFANKLTKGQLCQIARLVRPASDQDNDINMPYIKSVTKHWYYEDIDFTKVYKTAKKASKEINILIPDDSGVYEHITKSKLGEYVSMVAESTIKSGVKYQEEDPEVKGPNSKITKLFTDYKYYKYDGTIDTAYKIAVCKAIDRGDMVFFFNGDYHYLTAEDIANATGVAGASSDNKYEKGWKNTLYQDVSFESKENTMSAFSILENADTDEAEFCLRCLKELLVSLKYYEKKDLMSKYTKVLSWCFKQKGIRKDDWILDRSGVEYGLEVKGLNKADEDDKSKINECKVIAPGDGEIIKIEDAGGTTHVWNTTYGRYDTEQTNGKAITIKFGLMSEEDTEKFDKKLNDDYYEIEKNKVTGADGKEEEGKQGVTVLDKTMTIKYLDKLYFQEEGTELKVGQKVEKGDELGIIAGHSAFVTMENADGTEIGRKKEAERNILTSEVTGKEEEEDVTMYDDIEDFMSPSSAASYDWFDGEDYSDDEIKTILSIIAAEAAGFEEDVQGVCSTVINRYNQGNWSDGDNTILGILTAKNQFEAYSEGSTTHGWYKWYTGQSDLDSYTLEEGSLFVEVVDEIFCSGEATHEYASFKAANYPCNYEYQPISAKGLKGNRYHKP